MLFSLELIFLLLVNVWGLEVVWNDDADFDEDLIQGVNDGSIEKAELRSYELIFPGTLWCGVGNISQDVDDLGYFEDTDRCCRTHDMCNDFIEAGETRYNLTNLTFYTTLNCKCDSEFYACLKAVNSLPAIKMGFLYFNMLETQCYQHDYPKAGCKNQEYFPFFRCLEYNYDTSKEKIYQWFDLPLF